MRVDFVARERQYAEHLRPVYDGLDPAERGEFYGAVRPKRLPASGDPVAVASSTDMMAIRRRPIVRFEHGIGLTYGGRHGGYAGGDGADRVALFAVPNERAAAAWRARYPRTPVEVVGTPKLDPWHRRPPKPVADRPVVALSFHWDAIVVPETRSAFPHFRAALAELAGLGDVEVLGHGHPRVLERLRPEYEAVGLEVVADFAEVLDRADAYVVDNSSTLYEFASTDRPVVLLNPPWYRRWVTHGLRFWEHSAIGPDVVDPGALPAAIYEALADPPRYAAARRTATDELYPYRGRAAERAAEVLRTMFG